MRVFRVLVGMVLLSVAAPSLLAGAVAWYAMQHRDADGWFRARVETVAQPGYAIVVPDLDALLRRDAPIARAGRTSMRITAFSGTPLFIGLAAPKDVGAFLQNSAYAEISGVSLSRGPLDARTAEIAGVRAEPVGHPEDQPMWQRSATGTLDYEPSDWRGRPVALVVLAPDGAALGPVTLTAAIRFGWLDSTTWGLLILGPVLLLLGFVTLAWPARQVVYVLAGTPGDPGISLRSGEPVSWKDAPTRENPVILPRPGSVYVSTFAVRSPLEEGLSAGWITAGAPAPRDPLGSPEDWARPAPAPSSASPSGAGAAPAPAGADRAAPESPELPWPPAEEERRTPAAVDVPTQEMRILDELPYVPLQLSGATPGSSGRSSAAEDQGRFLP